MFSSKMTGLILLSAGAFSILASVLNAAPGTIPDLPQDAILRLGSVIGLSIAGAVLLSSGVTLVLYTGGTSAKRRIYGRR